MESKLFSIAKTFTDHGSPNTKSPPQTLFRPDALATPLVPLQSKPFTFYLHPFLANAGMNGNENPAPRSSSMLQPERLSEELQWVWEPLVIDPPDICKSRLRKMVNQNAFLRENPVIGNGNIEDAVDLLYRFNYGTKSSRSLQSESEVKRAEALSSYIVGFSYHKIISPDCILLDPKLLLTFRHCYGVDEIAFASMVLPTRLRSFFIAFRAENVHGVDTRIFGDTDTNQGVNGQSITHPTALESIRNALMVHLFHQENELSGLMALWLWQCQREIISHEQRVQDPISWASKVEVIYNWIQFYLRYPSSARDVRLRRHFLSEAKKRCKYVPFNPDDTILRNFITYYGGVGTAIRQPTDLALLMLNDYTIPGESAAEDKESHLPIRDHAGEFDAKFICSGPFKFDITTDLTSHLKFSPRDAETILIFSDDQPYPGSRSLVLKKNVIIERTSNLVQLYAEVFCSFSLLFGQSAKGKYEARRLFGVPVDYKSLKQTSIVPDLSIPLKTLEIVKWQDIKSDDSADFDILGPRLRYIRNRMKNWSPKSVRDLIKPGYQDRFSYYTQLFALFIAAVGAVGVILSIVQTAYAVISTRYAAIATNDDSVQLALEKIEGTLLLLLNATEEMVVALKALQPNGAV